MKKFLQTSIVTPLQRTLLGMTLGFLIMLTVVQVFHVNSFDYENMCNGTQMLLSLQNPWAEPNPIQHFYNPPFSVFFLWPLLFVSEKVLLIFGGSLLFGFVFLKKAWVSLAWFATNTFLWIIAAGGIDMLVIGAGLMLLSISDASKHRSWQLISRVAAYGILMVKPQGGLFIVLLYILWKKDWQSTLLALILYGLPFITLYPDWIRILLDNPPLAQTVATHTFAGKFGLFIGLLIALSMVISRRWTYWQLGGVLSAAVMPYGMPGLPLFLTLGAIHSLKAIPIMIACSALLASLTWINLPSGLSNPDYGSLLLAIYHLGMLSLAFVMALFSTPSPSEETLEIGSGIKKFVHFNFRFGKKSGN